LEKNQPGLESLPVETPLEADGPPGKRLRSASTTAKKAITNLISARPNILLALEPAPLAAEG
jgi:hypothetical protein